ncbi:MAG: anti-sigma factor antagonist [Desulfovibrionales bacterium]|nr:anti-sigma factor antagonist [Desulfovibrionales bacterium]
MNEVLHTENAVVVKPGQDIVAAMVHDFRIELKKLVQQAPQQLVLDLAGVQMIDSMGIGLLISAHNTLTKEGKQLVLINASANILGLFRSMRLDQHFSITGE